MLTRALDGSPWPSISWVGAPDELLHLLGVKGTWGPHTHPQSSSHGHVDQESSTGLGECPPGRPQRQKTHEAPPCHTRCVTFEQGTLSEPHVFLSSISVKKREE